jgi:hypothetical protein
MCTPLEYPTFSLLSLKLQLRLLCLRVWHETDLNKEEDRHLLRKRDSEEDM